jgi:hypothetical protein
MKYLLSGLRLSTGLRRLAVALLSLLVVMWVAHPTVWAKRSAALTGTIAYTTGQELRPIEADGSNDRLLFQVADAELHKINGLAWHPAANQLAFTSSHETTCSRFRSDIFTIYPDGSNLQRITNSPACSALAGYATGTVTVQVANQLLGESIFILYVDGAPEAQTVVVPAGVIREVTVTGVADLGPGVEQRVVIFQTEQNNWIWPTARVDVIAGQTVSAGEFPINNSNRFDRYGAYEASWRRSGEQLAFALGSVGAYQISATPAVVSEPTAMFDATGIFASAVAYSPVSDEVLLYNPPIISRATPGDPSSITPVAEIETTLYGMEWLPDGSGFVFAVSGGADENFQPVYANIWEHRFASGEFIQITNFTTEFAFHPSVSPDGQQIVFAYAASNTAPVELRIMQRDGTNVQPLGVNGQWPKWSPTTVTNPQPTSTPDATPTATTDPTQPTPTSTPVVTPDPDELPNRNYLPVIQGS